MALRNKRIGFATHALSGRHTCTAIINLLKDKNMTNGVRIIAQEREEQITKHGYDVINDLKYYSNGELLQAAKFCITQDPKDYPPSWSKWFLESCIKKKNSLPKAAFEMEMSKIAGALCAANIDRIIATEDFNDTNQ